MHNAGLIKQQLLILGSTGSVGSSTLDVVSRHQDKFQIFALTAAKNVALMLQQCEQFSPSVVVMTNHQAALDLQQQLKSKSLLNIEVLTGERALVQLTQCAEVDTVMSAIVGAAGLLPSLTAVQRGKRVLIANKEPLVMTGQLFMQEAKKSGAVILPIDSEHNAIFQCLPENGDKQAIRKIHLTGSGGPFRGRAWDSLKDVTPEQACAHPNWSMGRKISVDSATMMNKGLEYIEAASLFDVSSDQVEVLIHPQSIIHSMVEYIDGSFIAQLAAPDMRIPIAHALSWPDRINSGSQALDLTEISRLDFEKPDLPNMPCLQLAQQAAVESQSAPTILNAANEVAVEAFLQQRVAFTQIAEIISQVMERLTIVQVNELEHVLNIDNEARVMAHSVIDSF